MEAAHGEAYHDESTGLPLDPKMVDDAVEAKKWTSCEGCKSTTKCRRDTERIPAGSRRHKMDRHKGDASRSFVRARMVAQETTRVSELSPEEAISTFAATHHLRALESCSVGT